MCQKHKKMLKEPALNIRNAIKMLKIAYSTIKKTQQTVNITRSANFLIKWRRKAYFFFLFFNKIQMFEFWYCSNYGNVCVELQLPLSPDFAADFRYRSQSLGISDIGFFTDIGIGQARKWSARLSTTPTPTAHWA